MISSCSKAARLESGSCFVCISKQIVCFSLSIILNVNGTVDDDEQQNLVEDPENIHPPVVSLLYSIRFNSNRQKYIDADHFMPFVSYFQMKSKPPFVLKITKGDKTIAFQCSFPPPEELDISEEQQQKDYGRCKFPSDSVHWDQLLEILKLEIWPQRPSYFAAAMAMHSGVAYPWEDWLWSLLGWWFGGGGNAKVSLLAKPLDLQYYAPFSKAAK